MITLALIIIVACVLFGLFGLWCILAMPREMPESYKIYPLIQEKLDENK